MGIHTTRLLGSYGFVKYLIEDGVVLGRVRYEVFEGIATVRVIEIHRQHQREAVEDRLIEAINQEYQGQIRIKLMVTR